MIQLSVPPLCFRSQGPDQLLERPAPLHEVLEAVEGRAGGGQHHHVPRPRRPVTPAGGKVVDFTAYRQAAHPEEYAPREEAPGRPRPVRRRRTLALTVDLAATGAVVVLLAAVVLRFFAG